jgi:hypothetical protein
MSLQPLLRGLVKVSFRLYNKVHFGMAVEQTKQGWRYTALELCLVLVAILAGYWIAQAGFDGLIPAVEIMVGFLVLKVIRRRPFAEALALFVALSAFNFYYFYCARLTGRNPTDVGTWGVPATNTEKIMKDVVFMGLMALGSLKLFYMRLENHPFWSRKLNHPLIWLIILFIAYSALRGISWVFQDEDLYDLLYYIRGNMEFSLIPLIAMTAVITEEAQLTKVFRWVIYTLPVVSVLGIVEFLIHGSAFIRVGWQGQVFYRAASTLQNPNNLGGFLVTVLGIGMIYLMTKQYNRWEKWLFILSIPLTLTCLFMTISRSSIVFLVVTSLVCLTLRWVAHRRSLPQGFVTVNRKWLIWGAFALAAGGFVLMNYFNFHHILSEAASQYLDPNSSVAGYRIFAPFSVMPLLLENPFKVLFGITWKEVNFGPDNAFGYILLRNGLVGFVLYVAIWGVALWTCIRRVLWRYCHFLYWVCTYILVFQLFYGFSAPIHENFPHNLYFWVVIAILVWLESKPTDEVVAKPSLDKLFQQLLAYMPNQATDQDQETQS